MFLQRGPRNTAMSLEKSGEKSLEKKQNPPSQALSLSHQLECSGPNVS
jgi:hypothetical protein